MPASIALVTGGTSGIGMATAKILAVKGATVILSGLREIEGAQVVEEIRAAGGKDQFVRCDVRDEAAVQAMIEGIMAERGRLDWAVNCAAVSLETKLLAESDSAIFRTMIDINLMGLYHSMKHEIRQMQRQGGGAIVSISSIAGWGTRIRARSSAPFGCGRARLRRTGVPCTRTRGPCNESIQGGMWSWEFNSRKGDRFEQ